MSSHGRPLHRRTLPGLVAAALVLPVIAGVPTASAQQESATETVVGELVQAWPEHESPKDAAAHAHDGPLSWIETAGGDTVRVPTEDVEDIDVGSTVEVVVGEEVEDEATVEDGLEPAREVLATEVLEAPPAEEPVLAESTSPVTNEVTVVMMIPGGGTLESGRTLAQVVDAVQTRTRDFWSTQSHGAITLGVTGQFDWFQGTSTCSKPHDLFAEAAAHAGWTKGPGRHLLVYLPRNSSGCSYGLAEVGTSPASGGFLYVTDVTTPLLAHEVGHNFGLGHSSAFQCDGTVDAGSCRTRAYYDLYDVMGGSWGQVGSLNAAQAARLQLLPSDQQETVTASGAGKRLTLAPLSDAGGLRAVRLVDGKGYEYWLEYRSPSGQDVWLGSGDTNVFGLDSGVVLRRALTGSDTSLLLDGTPSARSGWNADLQTALPLGRSVPVSGTDLTVTVLATSPTGATVRVATAADPTVPTRSTLPIGALDVVSGSGNTLSVSGWAMDPNTPDPSSAVHVYVDGIGVALAADRDRPDIGAAFPHAGSAHGFSWSVEAPGIHRVCVYAIDRELSSNNTAFGCRDVAVGVTRPVGNWETLSAAGSTVSLAGWAFDPDSSTASSPVHVYVDGKGVELAADGDRPDVGRAFPHAGPAHGFAWSGNLAPGAHQVCVYAIDRELPSANTSFGCRSVTVAEQSRPVGSWDPVSVTGSTVSLAGWAFDPDSPTAATEVHVYVDGAGVAFRADGDRPDVGAAFPHAGPAHGFGWSRDLAPGVHRVCVYAIDREAPSSNTSFGCRDVTV